LGGGAVIGAHEGVLGNALSRFRALAFGST